MKKILTLYLVLFTTLSFSQNDKETFDQLKKLEGKWIGTINYTNRDSEPINLEYSIRSNGSAIVEESNEGGIEMMTIFNIQNEKILSTHYCGLQNRPVSELESNEMGVITFKTNEKTSDLNSKEDTFVGSWKLNLMPNKMGSFVYSYTVVGPNGNVFSAEAEMNKVK